MARWCPCLLALCLAFVVAAADGAVVVTAELRGGIGPASAAYLDRVLTEARTRDAALVVVAIDTPGGLDTAMRRMIQSILASRVPVALYVAPRGARAASAGTYLLYASHVAAMAPGTNVGAATPVAIGFGGRDTDEDRARERRDDGGDKEKPGRGDGKREARERTPKSPMEAKALHDAAAYIRSLAELRGRNAEWGVKSVVEADSLSATEARRQNVVDVVADDVKDLLRQVEGRTVSTAGGDRKLALEGAELQAVDPNWKERLLATIADPNIALLLLMAGAYGLLIELYVPGTAVPGVMGAIALLLGLYGLALLPVTFAGVALLLLGLGLMIAEAFLPSFGALGIGGVVAFVVGGFLLIDAEIPGFTVSWEFLLPLAVGNALAIAVLAAFALRVRRRRPVSGVEEMIGAPVEALEDIEHEGWVLVHGERWHARSSGPLRRGERARVVGVEGLVVAVEPMAEQGGAR